MYIPCLRVPAEWMPSSKTTNARNQLQNCARTFSYAIAQAAQSGSRSWSMRENIFEAFFGADSSVA